MIPLRDTIRPRHFPIVNWVILGLNTIVFLYSRGLNPVETAQLYENYALIPARVLFFNPSFLVTLFTSMFMHAGWFHFISNMWTLYIFGDNVEDRMGPIGYLMFYLLGGLAASGLQIALHSSSIIPTLGASGAIAGVLGAYVLMFPAARVDTIIIFFFIARANLPAFIFLGFWFVSQLYAGIASLGSTMAGGVAWWAHIGGFIFGLVLSRFFVFRPPPQPEKLYMPPPPPRYS